MAGNGAFKDFLTDISQGKLTAPQGTEGALHVMTTGSFIQRPISRKAITYNTDNTIKDITYYDTASPAAAFARLDITYVSGNITDIIKVSLP